MSELKPDQLHVCDIIAELGGIYDRQRDGDTRFLKIFRSGGGIWHTYWTNASAKEMAAPTRYPYATSHSLQTALERLAGRLTESIK